MKETGYLLQATLIAAWWVGLSFSRTFFDAFQFDEISPVAFRAFFTPDLALIAGLSVFRAYLKVNVLEYVILGAFGYAALYCVNATFLTNSGYLSTGLMLMGLGFNVFLCFCQFLFRNSSSSFSLNVKKTIVQIICIWALTLVVFPYVILDAFQALAFPKLGISLVFGSLVFVCCSALGLASSYFMVRDGAGTPLPLDQTNNLVVTGPYQYVRNPMAIAGIGQGIAIAIIFQSLPILIYSLLGALVWHMVVRPIEEHDMNCRFGDPYLDYQERVSCWIPKFGARGT